MEGYVYSVLYQMLGNLKYTAHFRGSLLTHNRFGDDILPLVETISQIDKRNKFIDEIRISYNKVNVSL